MLAGPGWNGKTPKCISKVIKGESDFLGTLTRTQSFSAEDMDNVREIQAQYELQPLSSFLVQAAPKTASEIAWTPGLRIPEYPAGHSDNIRPPKPGYPATLV